MSILSCPLGKMNQLVCKVEYEVEQVVHGGERGMRAGLIETVEVLRRAEYSTMDHRGGDRRSGQNVVKLRLVEGMAQTHKCAGTSYLDGYLF